MSLARLVVTALVSIGNVIYILGVIAVIGLCGVIGLRAFDKEVPDSLIAIGSAAVGALAGILRPPQ